MTLIDQISAALPQARRLTRPRDLLRRWASLRRERRALAALDDRLLDDVGITRAQADREAGRPPWNAPPHWRARW